MILPQFKLEEPISISEACDILGRTDKARIIAGGTDLLVNLKRKVVTADVLVSLARVDELKKMSFPDSGDAVLGPTLTIAEVAESSQISADFPVLSKAAGKLGSPQIRNRATLGGNVCTARPAGDTIGPLIAYGATARIASSKGDRVEDLEAIFEGPGQTVIRPGEILTSIMLKKPAKNTGGSYIKYTIRNAMEIALVSVTTLVSMENGLVRDARVVVGAVAPTFIRCEETERFLVGKSITAEVADEAGNLFVNVCSPISDIRASASYRLRLVRVLVKRALMEAASSVVA